MFYKDVWGKPRWIVTPKSLGAARRLVVQVGVVVRSLAGLTTAQLPTSERLTPRLRQQLGVVACRRVAQFADLPDQRGAVVVAVDRCW
jgi:hypothetical protein